MVSTQEATPQVSQNTSSSEQKKMPSKVFERIANLDHYDVDKYYGDDDIAKDILKNKYLAPWETSPGEMWERLANGAASVEPVSKEGFAKEFYHLLSDFKFVPGGRINYGLGRNDINVSTSNCYVIANREDSLKGIYQFLTEQGLTYAATGGVGTDISMLRPRGTPISRGGTSPGAVSFMDLYSINTNTIAQNGRRGACMLTISVDHPDVEEFITIKSDTGRSKVKHANISIRLTDEFLSAVENNNDFDLRWNGKVYKTVNAKELWNKIIKHARDSAEPGLLFWDRMKEYHNLEHFPGHEIVATNPCFTGDTRIATQYGLVPIYELYKNKLELKVTTDNRVHADYSTVCGSDYFGTTLRKATKAFKTSDSEEVYRVETQSGFVINTTKYHKFITPEGFSELQDLSVGDEVLIQSGEGQWGTEGSEALGAVIGLIESDGHETDKKSFLEFWGEDRAISSQFLDYCNTLYKESNSNIQLSIQKVDSRNSHRIGGEGLSSILSDYGYTKIGKVPEVIWRGNRECVLSYIKALFSGDGTINWTKRNQTFSIRLNQSNRKLLTDVQCLLANFGIASKIYHRRDAGYKRLPDGKGGHSNYWCKDNFELVISKLNALRFGKIIGFHHEEHQKIFDEWKSSIHRGPYAETFLDSIVSIEYIGKEPVYCLTQEETHSVIANGIVIGQCAEQALGDGASCNLGHMNVAKYCVSKNGRYIFDWSAFESDCATAVRFMDNVLDWNDGRHATEKQNQVCKEERRVGIGITGLADAMVYLGIRYDSQEGIDFAGKIMQEQCIAMYTASVELAKERGAFPIYNQELYFKSKFIQELPQALQSKIKEYGIRNSLLNTIAPVGTGSIIAQCSSGVEPIFAFSYLRNVKDHTTSDGMKQYKVYHPIIKELYGDDSNLPDHVVSSHDINWENRVKLQGACQRWVDSAISSTINLPENVTVEDVAKIYFTAWKAGLKGVTVYREGSREGVLITEKKEKKKEEKKSNGYMARADAPKRPKTLLSETHKIKVDAGNGEIRNAYITVSFFDGTKHPYEIFVNAPIKEDKDRQIMDLAARTTSMMLRHNVPMKFIVEQLEKVDNQFLYSIPTNIAKILRKYDINENIEESANLINKYVEDKSSFADVLSSSNTLEGSDYIFKTGDEQIKLDKCPSCKMNTMRYENGCKVCNSCGYSGCSG